MHILTNVCTYTNVYKLSALIRKTEHLEDASRLKTKLIPEIAL